MLWMRPCILVAQGRLDLKEDDMRVLVTWSSKRGGTEGIGRTLRDALETRGFESVALPVNEVKELDTFGAVIVGSALYSNRWTRGGVRFVNRHLDQLRKIPVWFFSSGPLDDSADREDIAATRQVAALADRVGAQGHVTFGGRLKRDARGFPASAMARSNSGDWRNPERIRAWAEKLAGELPRATPLAPVKQPARSNARLLAHAVMGWALCAVTMTALLQVVSLTAALVIHAAAAPLFFTVIAWHYFRPRGARDPLPTAAVWTAAVALLDFLVVAILMQRGLQMFSSLLGTWLPFALIFLSTGSTGLVMSVLPDWEQRRHEPEPSVRETGNRQEVSNDTQKGNIPLDRSA
jgi:menaquinone-dependent protoporphyrinogen oxidase